MKKLMILGGSRYILPVIKAAHELGAYVITCDYLPDNYAHRFADHYENISVIDREKVLEYAEKEKIDGISAFACDAGVVSAAYVAEKMGLPAPGPLESVEILQNKGLFRSFLKEHGFHVPVSKSFRDYNEALAAIDMFRFPVIVKPTDSCGSKGVTRVDDPEKLKEAISVAVNRSFCGEFIIEEFITQAGFASDSDAFSVDGELKFISFNSQRFDAKAENPYTPAGFSWPASISAEHQNELTSEIQRLLRLLSMGTSIYNIEARVGTDGIAYIMEVSPRGGGNRLAECVRYATGVDMIDNSVRAALGEELLPMHACKYNGDWAEVILHSQRAGQFDKLTISDKIKKYVVERDLWVKPGDEVGAFSGANQSLGTLIFKFDDQKQITEVLEHVDEFIQIHVRQGEGQ